MSIDTPPGSVTLVGAGPGDPELLTLRAARLIAAADAVVYDHLVGEHILTLIRDDAERIYVGKEAGNHTLAQEEINHLLVRLAHEGKHVVRLKDGSLLNRYWDRGDYPRAEMYRDDVETAEKSGRDEKVVYRHIRSACESGWDFSSRWLADKKNLYTIQTNDIIPVDLNCLLYNLEQTLAGAYMQAGDLENGAIFQQKAQQRHQAILRYCWDNTGAFFKDYDFVGDSIIDVPSLAGMFPLFFNLAIPEQAKMAAAVLERDFLKAGGLLTTLNHTGQQWDAPNGWAPLQWISIRGLHNYGYHELADKVKNHWVDLNVRVYRNTGKMVEKYNVEDMTLLAGGGEYPVQDGFGWTNGVLLRLLMEK